MEENLKVVADSIKEALEQSEDFGDLEVQERGDKGYEILMRDLEGNAYALQVEQLF